MSREFELRKEVELEASPEQVWDAIATGRGMSSWFMGEHTFGDGTVALTAGDFRESYTITAWDPPNRFASRGDQAADGSFHAMEYVVEGRAGGTTVLRFVHSGFLGADWGDEYLEATGHGWDMYLHTLGQYLKHFPGRYATYVSAEARVTTPPGAWSRVLRGLGVGEAVSAGDAVHLTPQGMAPVEGVVDWVVPAEFGGFLGVLAADDGLYRFHGARAVGHHVFSEVDADDARRMWQDWLDGVLAGVA